MIRNPSIDSEGIPELNEDEELLFSCDSCGIEFGDLSGNGSFFVTTQRIVWITPSTTNNEDDKNTCYSFSCVLTQLMVHALCKAADTPYLFLQIEHHENEIRITHASYDSLQNVYDALCNGQKLNPCDGDSSDGGEAFMCFDNSQNENDQQRMEQISQMWDHKLQLNETENMVNNNGYLEQAMDGQFDDVDNDVIGNNLNDKQGTTVSQNQNNPYLDPEIINDLSKFAPEYNQTFEDKFKSYRDVNNKDTTSDKQ